MSQLSICPSIAPWFSSFLEKQLVARVYRRIDVRIVR